jgi:hypothetical protein
MWAEAHEVPVHPPAKRDDEHEQRAEADRRRQDGRGAESHGAGQGWGLTVLEPGANRSSDQSGSGGTVRDEPAGPSSGQRWRAAGLMVTMVVMGTRRL